MTNTVLLKRSSVPNSIPGTGNLSLGELAINYADGNLFYKNSGGTVKVIASSQFVSVTGNIEGGNVNTVGLSLSGNVLSVINSTSNVNTTGNVSANYFIGNGSLLTGITASGGSNISNGTSNVKVVSSGGNVTVGIGGTSNVVVWATTGEYVTGLISATGNISGSYFIGNGSLLTGISSSGGSNISNGTSNVSIATSNGNVTVGVGGTSNVVVFATTGEYVTGLISATGNITAGNLNAVGLSLSGNVISAINTIANITTTANISGGNLLFGSGVVTGTGNITGGNIITSGTGGNITGANVVSATTFSATGNVIAGNVNATGLSLSGNVVSALTSAANITTTANISGGNVLFGSGIVSGTGNISGGNLNVTSITGTTVSASGNITGGNVLFGSGIVSGTGNISGGNVNATNIAGTTVSASGNITGANVNTSAVTPASSGTLSISTVSGNINLQPTSGNIVVNSTYINGLLNPQQDQDAATKNYVDNLVSTQIAYHEPVAVATTTTLATTTGGTITYTQPNGAGNGVGALLETTGAFDLIDTANVQTLGTRILVKNEGNAVYNGVYVWSNTTAIIRSTDADEYGFNSSDQLSVNDYFFVQTGNVNAGTAWVVNAPSGTITFGTSNITFAQFSSSQVYTANTAAGISLAGTVINAKVDNVTTAFDGGGNIVVKTGATLTTPDIGAATGTSLSVTGNVTGNYFIGNGALLTGIATGSSSNISNGTSNVTVVSSGGNIAVGVGGTSNVVVFATTGEYVTGLVSATGNITGSYFYGNGSQLTGITASAGVSIASDDFTGDGSTTTFTLSVTPTSINQTVVNYNGATLLRNSYTINSNQIDFNNAPALGAAIEVTVFEAGTSTIGGSNTEVQFNDSGVFNGNAGMTYNKSTQTFNATNITQNSTPVATTGKAIAMAIVFGG